LDYSSLHTPNSSKFRLIVAASCTASAFRSSSSTWISRKRLLKVEVGILVLGRDADVAAGREAPVVGGDLGAVDELDQAFDVAQFGVGEALDQPVGLAPVVADLLELVDGGAAGGVGGLAGAGDVAARPGGLARAS
jgi:hypothetical protein